MATRRIIDHETRPATGPADGTRRALGRRGVIAGAAAVAAGLLAKQAAKDTPVAADNGTWTFPYTGTDTRSNALFSVTNMSTGMAIAAQTTNTEQPAVQGGNNGAQPGVRGANSGGVSAFGPGVVGTSSYGNGVFGQVNSNTAGVKGQNDGSGSGVFGQSATGYEVLGYTTGGSASLSGISTNGNIPAFAGGNSVVGGLAASFGGTVFVNGMFVVADMTQKHGLLKHPDGSHRLMYTVEAPESWAEDFGTGTLTAGIAEITLDPDFAALIHTDDYHVFLTAHGDYHVHVAERRASGFVAQVTSGAGAAAKGLATVSGTFSWRIVAKPKSDNKVERLGKFTIPNVKYPDPATLPKPADVVRPVKKP